MFCIVDLHHKQYIEPRLWGEAHNHNISLPPSLSLPHPSPTRLFLCHLAGKVARGPGAEKVAKPSHSGLFFLSLSPCCTLGWFLFKCGSGVRKPNVISFATWRLEGCEMSKRMVKNAWGRFYRCNKVFKKHIWSILFWRWIRKRATRFFLLRSGRFSPGCCNDRKRRFFGYGGVCVCANEGKKVARLVAEKPPARTRKTDALANVVAFFPPSLGVVSE